MRGLCRTQSAATIRCAYCRRAPRGDAAFSPSRMVQADGAALRLFTFDDGALLFDFDMMPLSYDERARPRCLRHGFWRRLICHLPSRRLRCRSVRCRKIIEAAALQDAPQVLSKRRVRRRHAEAKRLSRCR